MTTDSTSTSTGPSADAGPPWEVVEPAATEQAAGAATSTDLAVFDSIERTIVDIEARHKNVVYDLTTTKGNDAARKARKELVSARTAADDTYTAWNQPILEKQANARALRDGFKARVKLIEDPLDKAIEADEKRRVDEKKAKDLAEASRLKAIRDRISDIYAQPAACAGQASSEIELSIVGVEVLMTDKAFFEELQGEAEAAADVVLTKLRAMMSAAKASEDLAKAQRLEAERLAAERVELERQRAELAAQQEAARKAAEATEANRLAAIAQQEEERRILSERIQTEERQRAEVAAAAERDRLETITREECIAREAREAAEREAAERLAEQRRQLDEQRAQFESEQAAARAATAVRVEKLSESGATIATCEQPKPPVTVQIDAFETERQTEAARAAALPMPPVKRPDDERLTAAVAKAFEVEPTKAAEWLGTYDALKEIGRLQGVPV